jgi:F-type H+-transporting ATPase subunit gamma
MKMVSAAKLKRAQDAITRMRPYAEKLQEILGNVSSSVEGNTIAQYTDVRTVKNVLVVTFTSNRGLCGGFNSSVSKAAFNHIQKNLQGKNVDVLAIGKKAGEWLKIKGVPVAKIELDIFNDINFAASSVISEVVVADFLNQKYDQVVLIYNKFVNAAVQEVQVEQLLPIVPTATEGSSNVDYIYEPEKEQIILDLIPKSLKTQFYKALLDTVAGEHGARMTAMHQATDNAGALAKDLTLQYNKARQAAITTEILEIVGGAEALDNA